MRRFELLAAAALVFGAVASHGETGFLGVPLVDGCRVTAESKDGLTYVADQSHDEVVAFYRDFLKDRRDVKYRNWKQLTYIEDDGNFPWHSITVSKGEGSRCTVVIRRDNWTWILGTLTLRFTGVFVVLGILWAGMSASGAILSRALDSRTSGAGEPQPKA